MFCERKNSPASLIGLISSRGCVLFLTEEHRWTEHTRVRKIAAPPPSPPPKGRGVITEIPMWGGCRLLFVSLSVSTIAETLCVLCMPKAFCGLETCAKRLSELCALCERKKYPLWEKELSSDSHGSYLNQRVRSISHRKTQKNRTHKGSQRHQVNRYHRTLQLILVERPLWILYAGGLLWVRNVGGKVLLNLWVLWEKNSPASFANVLFLTDNTDEQNTQHSTETSSQPISQNLTANVS